MKRWTRPLFALLVASGCDAFSGTEATDADASAPADAAADAASADAGGPPIVDGSQGTDATPVEFCKSLTPPPAFCADFDAPSLVDPKAGWEGALFAGSSMVTLTDVRSFSPPRSVYSRSDGTNGAALYRQFTFTKRIQIQMKVWFGPLPSSGEVTPLRVLVPTDSTKDVNLFSGSGSTYFQQGSTTFSPATSSTTGSWRAVLVDVRLPSSITASVDGDPQWTNFTLPQPWSSPMTIRIEVGAATYLVSGSTETWIDDVVVRLDEP